MHKLLMVGLLAASVAGAAPSAYLTHLRDARKLAAKKSWMDAQKAYDVVLADAPNDAVALSEKGLVLLHAGDPKAAEMLFDKAIAASPPSSLAGATLYNLGLAREKSGNRAGAIEAYEHSLRVRDNTAVAEALKKLDPKAYDRVRSAPMPMDGPQTSPSAGALLAQKRRKLLAAVFNGEPNVGPGTKFVTKRKTFTVDLAGTGLTAVESWTIHAETSDHPYGAVVLAVQTPRGWYTHAVADFWEGNHNMGVEAEITGIEPVQVAGTHGLAVHTRTRNPDALWTRDEDTECCDWCLANDPTPHCEGRMQTFDHLALVAVGASGAPVLTPRLLVGVEAIPGYDEKIAKPQASAHLEVTYSPTGIALRGPVVTPTSLPKSTWQDLVDELKPGETRFSF